jgi:preprotein translocase subunit Sss1
VFPSVCRGFIEEVMEAVDSVVRPVKEFAKDSIRLVKRCHKPDRRGICNIFTMPFFFLML